MHTILYNVLVCPRTKASEMGMESATWNTKSLQEISVDASNLSVGARITLIEIIERLEIRVFFTV